MVRPTRSTRRTSTTSPPRSSTPTKDGKVSKRTLDEAKKLDAKFNSGNPVAAMQLAKAERKAIRTGTNPVNFKGSKGQQTARLLTILVEFNDRGERRLLRRAGPQDGLR